MGLEEPQYKMTNRNATSIEPTDSTQTFDLLGAQSSNNDLDDEALLDLGGGAAILMGVRSFQNGNPGRGTQLVSVGLAAIGGRRVLKNYFSN